MTGEINPFLSDIDVDGDGKKCIYFLNISSYRGNDDEQWRNIRLLRVAEKLIKSAPRIAVYVHQVHDHKGTLYVAYRGIGRDSEHRKAAKLLEAYWEEEGETDIDILGNLTYSPHYHIQYPYSV